MSEEVKEEYNEQEILILLHQVLAKLERLEKIVRKAVDKEIEEEKEKLQEQLDSLKDKVNKSDMHFYKLKGTPTTNPFAKEMGHINFQPSENAKRFAEDFVNELPELIREREIAYRRANPYDKYKTKIEIPDDPDEHI